MYSNLYLSKYLVWHIPFIVEMYTDESTTEVHKLYGFYRRRWSLLLFGKKKSLLGFDLFKSRHISVNFQTLAGIINTEFNIQTKISAAKFLYLYNAHLPCFDIAEGQGWGFNVYNRVLCIYECSAHHIHYKIFQRRCNIYCIIVPLRVLDAFIYYEFSEIKILNFHNIFLVGTCTHWRRVINQV